MSRAPLKRMLRQGMQTARFCARYVIRSRQGHVLLHDLQTPAGELQHIWIPRPFCGQLGNMAEGSRISFIADLEDCPWAGRVNLMDVREVEVLR